MTPKNKHRMRCYIVWRFTASGVVRQSLRHGGKIVWLTDKQVTFYTIADPSLTLEEVTEKDTLAQFKKYQDQNTIA
jgi:hypothetical protein